MDTGAFARLQDEMAGLKKEVAALKTAPPPAPAGREADEDPGPCGRASRT